MVNQCMALGACTPPPPFQPNSRSGMRSGSCPSLPPNCPSWTPWRVCRKRLRTCGWSSGAGSWRGCTPWGCSASASMASHASCGIHPLSDLAGAGSSPLCPYGAGGLGPRGNSLHGPTSAAPTAVCGSSAATTVPPGIAPFGTQTPLLPHPSKPWGG